MGLMRHTDTEGCVQNVLIDKFPLDELIPAAHDEAERQVITGTLMSEYEGKIIKRFLLAVAGIFRADKKSTQHLLFSGLKNGGYLANIASMSWPIKKRGEQEKVLLHLIDDNEENVELTFNEIVDNFESKGKVHKDIRVHNLKNIDRLLPNGENIDGSLLEKDEIVKQKKVSASWFSYSGQHTEKERRTKESELHDVSSIIRTSSNPNNNSTEKTIIPYFHVGGQRMSKQLDLLEGAAPLFLNQSIVTVGIEHSVDMDIDALLHFFNSLNYRTYLLGKYHLVRIDNICKSILNDIMERPEFKVPQSSSSQDDNINNNVFG